MLLTGECISTAPLWLPRALAVLLPMLMGGIFLWRRPVRASLLMLALLLALIAVAALLFRVHLFYLPVTLPVTAGLVTGVLLVVAGHYQSHARAARYAGVLARFVSPTLLAEIDAHGAGNLSPLVKKVEVTVLFADLVDFTRYTQQTEPQRVSEFLARFYSEAIAILNDHQGTLDKFLGDGILAYWGAPEPIQDKEARAIEAAHALNALADRLSEERTARGEPPVSIRCGLATGEVAAGYFGDHRHAAYTIIGSAVNLAARLQAKAQPGGILADDLTAERLPTDFSRDADHEDLKGIGTRTVWHIHRGARKRDA